MSATPREVFLQLLNGITEGRFDDLGPLYADDCVVDVPYTRPEPTRHEGRAALEAHFEGGRNRTFTVRADNIVVHETTDPEVIVSEWDYHFRGESGKEVTVANIQVLRVRDGKILTSRDFHDHVAVAAVLT